MPETVPYSNGHGQPRTGEAIAPPPKTLLRKIFAPNSIRSRLIVSLLAIYVLGSLAAFAALYAVSRVESKITVIESFLELNQKILETRRNEKNYLLYGNAEDLISARTYLTDVRQAIALLGRRWKNMVEPRFEEQIDTYDDLLHRLSSPHIDAEEQRNLEEKLREHGHVLTQFVLDTDARARKAAEKEARRYEDMTLVILASALLLGGGLSVLLVRWITRPLQSIRSSAARVMRGELSTIPADPLNRQSVECAELVDSLNLMLRALAAKQNQLIQSAKLAAIGKVTAGIAHEINNPLNNIFLTAEVMLEVFPSPENGDQLEIDRKSVV